MSAALLAFNIGSSWSRTLKLKHRLKAAENSVLRKAFGPKMDEVTGRGEDNIIDIDIFMNCSWVDTRWQYTFTHKQYTEHHN
jgi:hypothetical protein